MVWLAYLDRIGFVVTAGGKLRTLTFRGLSDPFVSPTRRRFLPSNGEGDMEELDFSKQNY